jgi:O-antigen/teichoic acid export membrane protein
MISKTPEVYQRFWAFLDQGMVSIGNFITTLLLARTLRPGEFGIFALLFGSIVFLNTVHAALVTYPLSIHGAPMTTGALQKWTTKAISGTLMVGVGVFISISLICFAAGEPGLTLVVSLAAIAWQLQETTRTTFFAHLRQKQAVPGDATSYLGQAVLIALLWNHGAVTLQRTFSAIAFTSFIAFCIQVAQLKLSFHGLSGWREFVFASQKLGTWGLPARVASFFTAQAFPWVLFYYHGAAAAGIFQALGSSVAVSNPVVFSTCNLITATVAGDSGAKRLDRALRHALYGLAIVCPYFLLGLLNPHFVLRIFYGAASVYVQQTLAFRIMVVAYALQALALMASCVIGGLADTRGLFRMQLIGMATALLFGLPAAARYGVWAAALGLTFVQASQVVYGIRSSKQLYQSIANEQRVSA